MTIILTKKQFDYIFDLIFYNTKDGYNGECEFEHLIPHDKANTTEELKRVLWRELKGDVDSRLLYLERCKRNAMLGIHSYEKQYVTKQWTVNLKP